MPANPDLNYLIIFFSLIVVFLMASSIICILVGGIRPFIICLILGFLFLFVVIKSCYSRHRYKYLILEDNKIKIRRYYYFGRFKDEEYNNEDIIKAEIKSEKFVDSDGDNFNYFISIITKEEKQITIFNIREDKEIGDMEGLNNLINYINSYIQNKREMF